MTEFTRIPISAWAEEDRPREKMLNKGKNALNDAELLALILGTGTRAKSALMLAQELLVSVDYNLQRLARLQLEDFRSISGIGDAKAVKLLAALELGRRRLEVKSKTPLRIKSSEDVYGLMYPLLAELAHEEFWVVYVSNSNEVVYKWQVSKGGLTGTVVDKRLIFKYALYYHATGIILCHNHPSGLLHPSDADLQLTQKVKQAGEQLDVKVLDHLIVTHSGYYSFADEGDL